MSNARVNVREPGTAGAAGAFGASPDGQAPLAARARANVMAPAATPSRSWWVRGLGVVRNAAIAVAVIALVPIGLVMFEGDRVARSLYNANVNVATRSVIAERVRPFRVPTDPSITPLQAGRALNALQPVERKEPGFETIEPATRPIATWRARPMPSDLFTTARSDLYNGPSNRTVLEASTKGFSAREMEYLHALATAPVWREFDLVARAPAVDIIGGQFRTPFGADVVAEALPLPSFRDSRDLAYAAVSRATYHMAVGQRDSAETVLRSIISYGFTLIDNGSSALDELIGVVIVGTGRDALHRFYVIQHDPRADLVALAQPVLSAVPRGAGMSADDVRRQLIARIDDPMVSRAERFEGVRSLSRTSCTNVRELLFGPRADVRHVLDNARHSLARYPSEQALLDLELRSPLSVPSATSSNSIQSLAVSSATVAGIVLHNPRLAACTRILTWGR